MSLSQGDEDIAAQTNSLPFSSAHAGPASATLITYVMVEGLLPPRPRR
jgi:hypothetical protein